MSIRNQQIGWSQTSKLWWEVLKQFNTLLHITGNQLNRPLPVDNAQIGWRNEEYLLREISKKVAQITSIYSSAPCPTTSSTTTAPPYYYRPLFGNAGSTEPICGQLFPLVVYTSVPTLAIGVQLYTDTALTIPFDPPKNYIIGTGISGDPIYNVNLDGTLGSIYGTCA